MGSTFGRRRLLAGVAATAAGAGMGLTLTGCLAASDPVAGSHPALAPPREHAVVALLRLPSTGAPEALRRLAARLRDLPGSTPGTIGLASTAFDALGLPHRRPAGLSVMPVFPGDVPMPQRTGADLVLQVEGARAEVAAAALDRVLADVPELVEQDRIAGVRPENRVTAGRALTRNGFGFVEGWGNPGRNASPGVDAITLVGAGEAPDWAVGGSYLVVRVVRLAHELWDLDPLPTQESIIGRHPDGQWLDGTPADGVPDFAADPDGSVTPLDSHVRRADPRTPGSLPPPLVRRSWTYDAGTLASQDDRGILFMCYQRDVAAGFEAVQHRLAGQALDLYLLTVGGGYFLVPPPDQDGARWEDRLLGG